jgi:TonB family protein
MLLVAAAPPPAAEPGISRPARQRAGSISNDDYPAAAIQGGEQGSTLISIRVGRGGQVVGCRVAESSGSPVLDATSCALARQRFKYHPARDGAGNATEASVTRRIRWRLPPAAPAPARTLSPFGAGEVRMAISQDSLGIRCAIELTGSAIQRGEDNPCPEETRVPMSELERDSAAVLTVMTLTPDGQTATPRRGVRGTLMASSNMEFSIDASGRLTSCRDLPGGTGSMPSFCQTMINGTPMFLADPANAGRRGRIKVELYRLGAPET